jgi:hypothetical protein
MDGQIAEDDHAAGLQGWRQLGLDEASKRSRLSGALIAQCTVRPAMNVWVAQRLVAALASTRMPRGAQLRIRVSLVEVTVLSMNTRRPDCSRMRAWRSPVQRRRAAANPGRRCTTAVSAFSSAALNGPNSGLLSRRHAPFGRIQCPRKRARPRQVDIHKQISLRNKTGELRIEFGYKHVDVEESFSLLNVSKCFNFALEALRGREQNKTITPYATGNNSGHIQKTRP